ncbi:hypothetical protein Syun_016975 [Stephania yunnanensis]|uniref:Uncharacterized protein n=1 Tax=Stephania yunnanensis TaxID=152371 RepID=A0AAP0J8B4_9MAGN
MARQFASKYALCGRSNSGQGVPANHGVPCQRENQLWTNQTLPRGHSNNNPVKASATNEDMPRHQRPHRLNFSTFQSSSICLEIHARIDSQYFGRLLRDFSSHVDATWRDLTCPARFGDVVQPITLRHVALSQQHTTELVDFHRIERRQISDDSGRRPITARHVSSALKYSQSRADT